jgi:hypothetical protein
MLCCVVGGALVAALLRSSRRRRAHSPVLALAFGLGAGALGVELIVTVLVPLGSAKAPGSLAARLSLLIVPAFVAGAAGLGGAAGSLLTRPGVTIVTAAALAGAVAVEDVDLHLLRLHSAPGVAAAVAVHAPAFLFVAGGLRWRSKLPASPFDGPLCGCDADEATAAQRAPATERRP